MPEKNVVPSWSLGEMIGTVMMGAFFLFYAVMFTVILLSCAGIVEFKPTTPNNYTFTPTL